MIPLALALRLERDSLKTRDVTQDPTLPPRGFKKRVRTLWKSSIFNPYYVEKRLLRRALALDAPRLSGSMLDVGCGDRPYAKLFTHVRYIGMEHPGSISNVEPALRVSFKRLRSVVNCFGDANAIPFADATFDSCLCTEVLEHVPDPLHVSREIVRILKPGGRAIVTVPFAGELHQTPYDFRRFTIFGIRRVLEDAGLEVESIRARGNIQHVVGVVRSHAIYRLGAREILPDGSVSLAWWSMPFVFVACAMVQLATMVLGAVWNDEAYTVGYVVVARKRVER